MAKNKRTPTGRIGDAHRSAGADWEVEKIVAVATGKDGNRYLVRWKGWRYAEKHDTYPYNYTCADSSFAWPYC